MLTHRGEIPVEHEPPSERVVHRPGEQVVGILACLDRVPPPGRVPVPHVWERVRSDYHVSRARFDDRADAEEFLAALIAAENFGRNSFGYPLDS